MASVPAFPGIPFGCFGFWGRGPHQSVNTLVTHEWGTFTSVAGVHGEPVLWAADGSFADLPCFVARLGPRGP